MKNLRRILLIILMLFMRGNFAVLADETDSGEFQNIKQEEKISVLDFKKTPIADVFKIFTDLTGKNVVASSNAMKFKVTLFLKEVSPHEALKTMCKLYNLWFTEEDNVIRVMTVEEYAKELTIRRDEKTVVYKLKYASCLAVADLLNSLFGDRIEYVEPKEIESYGHVGTEEGKRRGGGNNRRGYKARTNRKTYISGGKGSELGKDISSKVIESLESRTGQQGVELKDLIEARQEQAVVYLAVFPRNNSIICRSVDLRILSDIDGFVKEMDTPTSQVLLEGKILEITLTDDFKSFFDFDITPNPEKGKHTANIGGFTSLDSATFVYHFVDKQIETRMELFEENNQVKIIGTPMILCANNAPGDFFIGEERPITVNYEHEIREFQERTTETVRPVIELRNIGTKLSITPSINEDKTVTMRFLGEVDSVKPAGASISFVNNEGEVITLPIDTVDTSRVENIIMAKDGSTLAIGGLVRETEQNYVRKVPVLGDLPLIGFFFKKESRQKQKTETVFLITPHIMMAPEEGESISNKVASRVSDHPYLRDAGKGVKEHSGMGVQKQMKVGEILSVDLLNNFAIINLGKNDGIEIGDIFSIYRNNKFIGRVNLANFRQSVSAVYPVGQTKMEQIRQGDTVIREEI